jgi:DNA-binding MarR family transcriptional regulator
MQIQDYTGFWLVRVCREHRQRAEEVLQKLGLHTGQELILLWLSEEEGMTQTRLAELLWVEPPTITKMLNRMKGLVERRQDSEDNRISRVYLTEAGRTLLQGILDSWQELETLTLAGLSEVEQSLLRRILMQVYTNLSASGVKC